MSDAPAVRNDSSAAFAELVLLPWESEDEFLALHRGLLDEHAPWGPTETRLVEQLTVLFWRRQRVIAADRALHLATLHASVTSHGADRIARRALVCAVGVGREDVREVIRRDCNADAQRAAGIELDQQKTRRALRILRQAGDGAYERALAALDSSTRDWWLDELEGAEGMQQEDDDEDEGWQPTAASLEQFLETEVDRWYWQARLDLIEGPAVRRQAFAESLDPQRAIQLQAYDARLDRQIERTLALLLRLQEIRQTRPNTSAPTQELPGLSVGSDVGTRSRDR